MSRGDLPLRTAVFLTTVAGIGTLVTADLLGTAAGAAGAALLTAASVATAVPRSRRATAARKWASTGLLAGTLLLGTAAALTGRTGGLTDAGPALAILLVGLTVAHALVLESVRDLTVGLALGGAMVLVAAGLAPGPAIVAPLVLAWVAAVTALVLAHDLHSRKGVDAVLGEPAGRPAARRVALTVLTAVAVGLFAFLVLPRPPSLSGLTARSGLAVGADHGSGGGRSAGAWSSGVLDMRTRGTLPETPVLSVPADSPVLWRAAVLDSYDGRLWSASTHGSHRGTGTDDRRMPGERLRADTVRPAGRPYDAVVAPGRPVSVAAAGPVTPGPGLLYLPRPGAYTVTSAAPIADPERLRAATGPDPDAARWTAVPPGLPARVTALGKQLAGGVPTRYDAVRAVEDHLRATATYRLDSPVPGNGEDAVDVFLFRDRTGFCEQFAAAEVVLLRSAGIPARLVTGFAGGTDEGDRRVLRESNAHAWAEVWFPGVGWVASDPTAGAARATGDAGLVDRVLAALGRLLATSKGRLVLAGVLALVVLAVMAARLVLRRRSRPRPGVTAPPPPSGPLVAAFERFETALAVTGRPREPWEGLEDVAARVPGSGPALRTVSRGLYGAAAPSGAESRAAAEALDRLSASLLAAASETSTTRR